MQQITPVFMLACLLAGCEARAVGNLAEVTLVDRDNGTVLTPHYYRGEYWVAGRPGARYAIEIRNRGAERLLAVTSIDGLNVLTGTAAGFDQSGYIFNGWDDYRITGWRKSDAEVAAFTFTPIADSYAARTGQAANIGVIGVALFRERPPLRYDAPAVATPAPGGEPSPEAAAAARTAPAPALAALADSARARQYSAVPAPQLGTGHGEREFSYVSHDQFIRQQPQPNEVIRIRYDSTDHLVALGVIPRPRPQPPGVDAFPAAHGQGYVPDPPG
jgi:hypothetical protein